LRKILKANRETEKLKEIRRIKKVPRVKKQPKKEARITIQT
jgi:hypothetical protein